MLSLFGLLTAIVVSGNSQAADNPIQQRDLGVRVSIIRLIATPDKYDGKVVFVSGYAFIEFENNCLCLVPNPGSGQDCLWINYDDGPYQTDADIERYEKAKMKWSKYHKKGLTLRGTFDATETGHLGGSSGAIGHITDVSVWDPNNE